MKFSSIIVLLAAIGTSTARDVIFPHSSVDQYVLNTANRLDDIDISGNKFHGLTTFANLPYVDCFANGSINDKFDIAFLGAQFDTGVTARPGARYGPVGIRLGSRRIVPDKHYDILTGKNPFRDWAKIVDCGDPLLTFLDNNVALKQLEKAHKVAATREPNNTSLTPTPRIITLGGDHTTTLAALRSTYRNWGAVSVVHFDSHIDTWDPDVLEGDISDYAGLNHGTFLHIAHEEGLISNNSIHVGVRAPAVRRNGDRRNDIRCGFEIVHARELDRIGIPGIIDKIKARVQDSRVYLTVDIDVLDPGFAPGTGTAEVGGWSTRELLSILDGLMGLNIIGGDIVEVAPVYDNPGETTTLAAAEIAMTLMQLMVEMPPKDMKHVA